MKRVLVISVTSLAVLFLAGCSQPTPAPVVTVTAQASQAPAPVDNSAEYISAIRANQPILANVSDAALLSLGHKICATLDNGATVAQVAQAAIDSTYTNEQANALGFVIGASVAAFCPAHTQEVKDFVNANGGSA